MASHKSIKRARELFYRKRLPKQEPVCPNCKQRGRHFVPPSFGEPGFYVCNAAPALGGNLSGAI